jgi:nucleoside-diphosphate-sugar epimerase
MKSLSGERLRGHSIGVTGGFGALGRCLVGKLASVGVQRLRVLDSQRRPTHGLACVEFLEHVQGDVRNADACERLAQGCEMVFHLAAQSHAPTAQNGPAETMAVNVAGTVQLLEACRRGGVRQVIFASSGQVYGIAAGSVPVGEDVVPVPHTLYGASKLAAEAILTGYASAFGLVGVVARLANLYGSQSSPETVVGRALGQASRGDPLSFAALSPVRDFITFADAAEGLIRLAEASCDRAGRYVVNVGSGRGTSIREMAEVLAGLVHREPSNRLEIQELGTAVHDPLPTLVLNPSRLRDLTGWTPPTRLQDGLRMALTELTDSLFRNAG